jgi:hypothetical protein
MLQSSPYDGLLCLPCSRRVLIDTFCLYLIYYIRMWKPANMFACFSVVFMWMMFLSLELVLSHETCSYLIFSEMTISLKTVCIILPLTVRIYEYFHSFVYFHPDLSRRPHNIHTPTYRMPLDTCTKVISMTNVLWRAWQLYWIQFPIGVLIFVLSQLISLISSRSRINRICGEINVSC